MKRLLFIVIVYILTCLPILENTTYAWTDNLQVNDTIIILNDNYKNPRLPVTISGTKPFGLLNTNETTVINITNLNDLQSELYERMINRDNQFVIHYSGDTSNLKNDISDVLDKILDSDPYLANNLIMYSWSSYGYINNTDITFEFNYLTTKEQEDQLDTKVQQVLLSIINLNMLPDEKEKAIHDYIVANVYYDTTFTKYSAYEALIEGTAVCQGYALLTYKMLTAAGITANIVTGKGNGENHAWNLVQLDGLWYQLDCTWDDPIPDVSGRVLYDYYNLSDSQISKDHTWDSSKFSSANTDYGSTLNSKIYSDPANAEKYKNLIYSLGLTITDPALPDDYFNIIEPVIGNGLPVSETKQWTIQFNCQLKKNTVTSETIYITTGDPTTYGSLNPNNRIPVEITVGSDGQSVHVKPIQPYHHNCNYSLIISQAVQGVEDNRLVKPVKMLFFVT